MNGKNGFGALCWRQPGKYFRRQLGGNWRQLGKYFRSGSLQPSILGLVFWNSEGIFCFFIPFCAFLVLNFFRFSHTPACHRAETTKMQQSKVCPRSCNSILTRINISSAKKWAQHTGIFKYTSLLPGRETHCHSLSPVLTWATQHKRNQTANPPAYTCQTWCSHLLLPSWQSLLHLVFFLNSFGGLIQCAIS